ncbi:MAG: EamA family transporter [archaeon]
MAALILLVITFKSLNKPLIQKLKTIKLSLILVGFFNIVGSLFSLYSIKFLGGASAAIIIQFTVLFALLFGFLFFKEIPRKTQWVGITLVLIGALIINLDKEIFLSLGLALGVLGTLFYSLAFLFARKATLKANPVIVNFVRASLMGFFALLIILLLGVEFVLPNLNELSLIVVGCTSSAVIGTILFYKGLTKIKFAYANALKINEASFAVVYALIFAIGIPSLIVIAGGIIVIAGSIIIALEKK